jgi:hypothetical protein
MPASSPWRLDNIPKPCSICKQGMVSKLLLRAPGTHPATNHLWAYACIKCDCIPVEGIRGLDAK